jgi:hypothetical protein
MTTMAAYDYSIFLIVLLIHPGHYFPSFDLEVSGKEIMKSIPQNVNILTMIFSG